jgi:hypothetical protein
MIYVIINFSFNEKEYEYELVYENSDESEFETKKIKLKYFDFSKEEDIQKIEGEMTQIINLIGKGLIPEVLKDLGKNSKKN